MDQKPVVLDQAQRAAEKQAAREADRKRLAAGDVSAAELAVENDFFANLDVEALEIEAVGDLKISRKP